MSSPTQTQKWQTSEWTNAGSSVEDIKLISVQVKVGYDINICTNKPPVEVKHFKN